MATLVLSSVGTALGGPLGGIVGSFLGSTVDRTVLGVNQRRQGPRLQDLAVQSSAYGETIPRVYGRLRVAGNVIWSPGLRESSHSSGSKRTGGQTTTYTYSASLAVAISARPIRAVRRIWADGKLIRGSDGSHYSSFQLRLYLGTEDQMPDPLIVAAERFDRTPAYRGMAYAVFEELQLAEFGNRIPALTFEVEADEEGLTVGDIVSDLCQAVQPGTYRTETLTKVVRGFGVGRFMSVRSVLDGLAVLSPISLGSRDGQLAFLGDAAQPVLDVSARELGAAAGGSREPNRVARSRQASSSTPAEVSLTYLDIARDYQSGLQRARRGSADQVAEQYDLPVAMQAGEAKLAAEQALARALAVRTGIDIQLPWRHVLLGPGDLVRVEEMQGLWRVTSAALDGFVVELQLEQVAARQPESPRLSDSGRSDPQVDLPHGPTVIDLIDLADLKGEVSSLPKLYVAATGVSPSWKRAELLASADGGASYNSVAVLSVQTPIGRALSKLSGGPTDRWDRRSVLAVELLNPDLWLEGRSEASVLAGANLALVGDEIIQFTNATATGHGRFALSGLLRGRLGTDSAILRHQQGERFILLDTASLLPFQPPLESLKTEILLKAVSPSQSILEVEPQRFYVRGRSLLPLSPVHLRARKLSRDIQVTWVRRSRQGFAWIDGTDAPLAEERELYQLRIGSAEGEWLRTTTTTQPAYLYTEAQQEIDFGRPVSSIRIEVSQVSALAGPGEAAVQQFHFG